MVGFLTRLWWAVTGNQGFIEAVKKEQQKIDAVKREQNRHRLDLCFKHRQEPNRSHFSEQNCHYCQLEQQIKSMGASQNQVVQVMGRVAHLDGGVVVCHLNSEGQKLPDNTPLYAPSDVVNGRKGL